MPNNGEDLASSAGGCGSSRACRSKFFFCRPPLRGGALKLRPRSHRCGCKLVSRLFLRGPRAFWSHHHYRGESRAIESTVAAASRSKTPQFLGGRQRVQLNPSRLNKLKNRSLVIRQNTVEVEKRNLNTLLSRKLPLYFFA